MRMAALELVLWMIAAYHVGMGAGAIVSDAVMERLAWEVFGIRVRATPQVSYLVKLLGVYVITFGLVVGGAALDPEGAPWVLNVVVLLYVLRIVNKLMFRELFERAFETNPRRVWIDVLMLAGFGGSVYILKP